MRCAVVITVRPQDTLAQAARCAAAVAGDAAAELFVVGNVGGDSAETPHPLTDYSVTCIADPNLSTARNAAVARAHSPLVAFLDADCLPTPDWLAQLTQPLLADATIVGVKGTYATRQRPVVARFLQTEYEEKYDRLRRQSRVDFIDLYSAVYRRDVLLANGGFDEQFPLLSDRELSFRLAARGYTLAFAPQAVVFHDHERTLAAYVRSKAAAGFWNAQVVRRFPERGWRDSHTPPTLKLQMVLVALLVGTLLLLPLVSGAWMVALALLVLFGLSTLPLAWRAWRAGAAVALATPLLALLRALALATGYGWGTIRPKPNIAGQQSTIGGANYVAKRLLDLVGGTVGSLVLLLLTPVIALAIKLDTSGPVFFRQERIGQGGRPFTIYKFRSMLADAEAQLDQLLDVDALASPAFKLKNDPRVTRVGRVLRRWSLDELPQFLNVLRGEMSLVGPRPEETRIVAKYSDWHRRRLAVKPGLSGPMQVNGRGDLALDERVRLELAYIESYSVWRDIRILWGTLPAVWRGDGAR